jgi:hypothetical protein
MLVTIKNTGKGSQGIYANGAKKPFFLLPGRARRFTLSEVELERARRVRTLTVVVHDDANAADLDDSAGDTQPNAESESGLDLSSSEVQHPVLETEDEGPGEAPAPVVEPTPWTPSRKKK